MTKTLDGTPAATTTATEATATTTEEEKCDGCGGAAPRRRLDNSLLSLVEGILLLSIAVTTVGAAAGSPATATTSMPAIDIIVLFIGRVDREGDDSSGVTTEDDDGANTEAGECAHNFLEVVLRRLWEGRFGRRRTTAKTTETSRDDEHKEDVVTGLMFEMLCEGESSSSSSTALPKCRSSVSTAARAGGADPSQTKGSRTGRGQRRQWNGGYFDDDNGYERLTYMQRQDDAHNIILFIKTHIMCLIL